MSPLEQEVHDLRRLVDILNMSLWLQVQQWHHWEAMAESRCPSCGGPVEIVREVGREGQPEGVRVEAVAA